MATYNLEKDKIQYTLKVDDYNNWDSGNEGIVLAGNTNVQWHTKQDIRTATRITYTWPATAINCSRMVIYIPFRSQSIPGRCAAYLTTKELGIKEVTQSSWIGPSDALNSGYIAKCANPYLDADFSQEANNSSWYGEGSLYHPEQEGIYFYFDLSQPMIPNGTYYVYIIQEEGSEENECELYGKSTIQTTLTYDSLVGGVYIRKNGENKKSLPYRYDTAAQKWKVMVPYIRSNGIWKLL